MKKLPRSLLLGFVLIFIVALLAIASWRHFLKGQEPVEKLAAGTEINELSHSEAEPPNDGEIVAVPCESKTKMSEAEFMVGKPGAFLKILPNGEMKQTSGEELAHVRIAFDPTANDAEFPVKVECAEDVEEADGAVTWYVSTLKTDQFFSTRKQIAIQTKITAQDQTFFETNLNASCVVQSDGDEHAAPRPCVRPKVTGITDLNANGKREFWFNEPYKWDVGVGVIEEPNKRILSACPGCAE